MSTYNPAQIEPKWQHHWVNNKIFKTDESDRTKPKYYVLDMFPYPSGAGLHVGHPEGYTATDIIARYKRMNGFNVLHPIGWDAFGLPAEQYAIKTGTHPAETTAKNIDRFRMQLQAIGFSYDWDREVNTTDPDYFKWTQWIFLQLHKRGLAYESFAPVNWCPALGTVLANEEVIDGKSEVGGFPVIRKPMRQWMLRITAYAERLLTELEDLDWPESIKEMQRNWIGKSIGAEVDFAVENFQANIRVFTTRPDTLFGATYMVLSPEHPLVEVITTAENKEAVEKYKEEASTKSELDRTEMAKIKTGVFTGAYAINPTNGKQIPIWIADYVLLGYGTGAIMAVPGHDERDWEFAKKFNIEIVEVVSGGNIEESAYTDNQHGVAINSANSEVSLNGLKVPEAKETIINWLESKGLGQKSINYRLRDWLFSRQRYWGEPFPIIHVDGTPIALSEEHLPIHLPKVESYEPAGNGEPPLANATDWLKVTDSETGKEGLRETNTMPQWAGSCWYYLRYISPNYIGGPVNPDLEKYWMPVDLYVGGAEHAVLHLLYARFWHKVLFDAGIVSTNEPFKKLINQGMILGEMEFIAFKNEAGELISAKGLESTESLSTHKVAEDEVEKKGDLFYLKGTNFAVEAKSHKMSKSRGNVINPDDVISQYGADALRLYEMFMGPLEQVKPWSMRGVEGVFRFLKRSYRLFVNEDDEANPLDSSIQDVEASKEQLKSIHTVIKKVTEDIEGFKFNTAISAMMVFINDASKWEVKPLSVMRQYAQILNPFAPHLAEEVWEKMQVNTELSYTEWPNYDESYLVDDEFTYGIQVNGKLRGELKIAMADATDKEKVLSAVKTVEGVSKYLDGVQIVKEVFVPKRIVNIVVK